MQYLVFITKEEALSAVSTVRSNHPNPSCIKDDSIIQWIDSKWYAPRFADCYLIGVDGYTVVDRNTPVPSPYTISKLVVRRRLREEGIEEIFNQIMDLNPIAKADWDDSTEILTSDPMFLQMLGAFKALGITDEQILVIIRKGTDI